METKRDSLQSPNASVPQLSEPTSIPLLAVSLIAANMIPPLVLRSVGGTMYHFFTTLSLWSAFYVATLAVLFRVQRAELSSPLSVNSKHTLGALTVVTLVPRMAWLGVGTLISLDALWYIDYGKFMAQGLMPYADFFFPYPPVFGYVIYAVYQAAPAVDSFRVLSIAFDLAIVMVLWTMSKFKAVSGPGVLLPLAYALLPFSIIESGFNGHFEPIANLFILLGIWCIIKGRDQASAILVGLGAATKTYAIFLIPILLLNIKEHRKKAKFVFLALLAMYLTFVPFSISVWLRGDFLLPGTAMPGLSTGFLDATLGFISRLGPTEFIAIIVVAFCIVLLMAVISARSVSLLESFRTALLYDILTAGFAAFLVIMILLTWIYPFLDPGIGVYWRYPTDIAFAKGASAAAGTVLMMRLAWGRWRTSPGRHVSNFQLSMLAAFVLMLLLSMSRDVFYGWYLLWAIPPLFALRDRRLLYIALASMLFIYPSYLDFLKPVLFFLVFLLQLQ
ncbi:MAG: glycosyltransferase 87 family protein, partial [Promethearchaeota archaeon]